MAINLASKYSDQIAEVFTRASFIKGKTAETYDLTGVKTLKVYTPITVEEVDYDRDGGLKRYGDVTEMQDVVQELVKPGRDVRDDLPAPILRTDVLDIKDLKPGMELTGTVRNVVDFGVFVDIGVHQDGLVHISQICDRFIKHPSQAVAVGDVVKVVVLEVDEKKHRISLSMRQAAGKK